MKIVLTGAPLRMIDFSIKDGHKYFYLKEADAGLEYYCRKTDRFGDEYKRFVEKVQPDLIVCVNCGCTERKCDKWIETLDTDAKIVSWSTDSHRHCSWCRNANLHFSSIWDSAFRQLNNSTRGKVGLFLPLWARVRPIVPFNERQHKIGMLCGSTAANSGKRWKEICEVKDHILFGSVNYKRYYETIAQFKYGLNIHAYPDAAANFRVFELMACGVINLCDVKCKPVLDGMFGKGNVIYYENVKDILTMDLPEYNAAKLQGIIKDGHTFQHRIATIIQHLEQCWDFDVATKLSELKNTKEGTLLNDPYPVKRRDAIQEQIRFLFEKIKLSKAKDILEIGTCAAHFDYLVNLHFPNIKLTTIDIAESSSACVNYLNTKYKANIEFICANSEDALKTLNKAGRKFGFVWLDGGHSFPRCYKDLMGCKDLGIKHICVDDYRLLNDVKRAVDRFVSETGYKLVDVSGHKDNRGIAYLTI